MKKNKMINWLTGESFGWIKNYDELIDRSGLFWFTVRHSFDLASFYASIFVLGLEEFLRFVEDGIPADFRFEKSDFEGIDVELDEASPTMRDNFADYLGIATKIYNEQNILGLYYNFCNHDRVLNELREHGFGGYNQLPSEGFELPEDHCSSGKIIMQRALGRYS